MLAVFEKGARERRGEAVLEIGIGAEFRQTPLWKLAAQQEAEALAEDEAFAAAAEFGAGAALKIEQVRGALALGETLYSEFEPAGGGDLRSQDAASEIAGAVPGLKGETGAADFERIGFRREREEILARFEQRGLFAGLEEVFDKSAELVGTPPGGACYQGHESGL